MRTHVLWLLPLLLMSIQAATPHHDAEFAVGHVSNVPFGAARHVENVPHGNHDAQRRAALQDDTVPGIRSKQRIAILSVNDGHLHLKRDPNAKKSTPDSITVIHLGPDHPPLVKTVYGTVPNTIAGPPYMAMTGDGRYGFVTSR